MCAAAEGQGGQAGCYGAGGSRCLGWCCPPEQGHTEWRARPLPSKSFSDGLASGLPLEEQSGDGAGGCTDHPRLFSLQKSRGQFLAPVGSVMGRVVSPLVLHKCLPGMENG